MCVYVCVCVGGAVGDLILGVCMLKKIVILDIGASILVSLLLHSHC